MKNNILIKTVSWILILFAVVTACGAIAYFTNGFTEDFKTFYVTVDDEDILSSASGYKISDEKPLNVKVKYTLPTEAEKGYSVKIVPNVVEGKDFDFTVDGETYSFQAESDLTAGFNIEKTEDSFMVKAKGDLNKVLESVYPGSEVSDLSHSGYTNMFLLVVEAENGEGVVTIAFSLITQITGIELSPNHIYF